MIAVWINSGVSTLSSVGETRVWGSGPLVEIADPIQIAITAPRSRHRGTAAPMAGHRSRAPMSRTGGQPQPGGASGNANPAGGSSLFPCSVGCEKGVVTGSTGSAWQRAQDTGWWQ